MKVLITNRLPEEIAKKFQEHFDCDYHDSLTYLSKEELIDRVKEVDALVCPLSERIDREIMEAGKNLKIIANFGAGYDNIDIQAANELGLVITNTPAKGSTGSTSELTMGIMIDLMRKITYYHGDTFDGSFEGWKPCYGLGTTLMDKTLGIIGMGRIGREVARKAQAFDMKVLYWNRTRLDQEEEEALGLAYRSQEELIKEVDVLTLHTAYTPELKHLINEESFDQMKKTAFLINASRGPIVKESALIEALEQGKIQGAALDVFEFEPEIGENLKKAPNLLMTPHLGNATFEARDEMGQLVFDNVLAIKNGQAAPNQVN